MSLNLNSTTNSHFTDSTVSPPTSSCDSPTSNSSQHPPPTMRGAAVPRSTSHLRVNTIDPATSDVSQFGMTVRAMDVPQSSPTNASTSTMMSERSKKNLALSVQDDSTSPPPPLTNRMRSVHRAHVLPPPSPTSHAASLAASISATSILIPSASTVIPSVQSSPRTLRSHRKSSKQILPLTHSDSNAAFVVTPLQDPSITTSLGLEVHGAGRRKSSSHHTLPQHSTFVVEASAVIDSDSDVSELGDDEMLSFQEAPLSMTASLHAAMKSMDLDDAKSKFAKQAEDRESMSGSGSMTKIKAGRDGKRSSMEEKKDSPSLASNATDTFLTGIDPLTAVTPTPAPPAVILPPEELIQHDDNDEKEAERLAESALNRAQLVDQLTQQATASADTVKKDVVKKKKQPEKRKTSISAGQSKLALSNTLAATSTAVASIPSPSSSPKSSPTTTIPKRWFELTSFGSGYVSASRLRNQIEQLQVRHNVFMRELENVEILQMPENGGIGSTTTGMLHHTQHQQHQITHLQVIQEIVSNEWFHVPNHVNEMKRKMSDDARHSSNSLQVQNQQNILLLAGEDEQASLLDENGSGDDTAFINFTNSSSAISTSSLQHARNLARIDAEIGFTPNPLDDTATQALKRAYQQDQYQMLRVIEEKREALKSLDQTGKVKFLIEGKMTKSEKAAAAAATAAEAKASTTGVVIVPPATSTSSRPTTSSTSTTSTLPGPSATTSSTSRPTSKSAFSRSESPTKSRLIKGSGTGGGSTSSLNSEAGTSAAATTIVSSKLTITPSPHEALLASAIAEASTAVIPAPIASPRTTHTKKLSTSAASPKQGVNTAASATTSFLSQGDLNMYTIHHLLDREILKFNIDILMAVKEWWQTATKLPHPRTHLVGKMEYMKILRLLYYVLVDSEVATPMIEKKKITANKEGKKSLISEDLKRRREEFEKTIEQDWWNDSSTDGVYHPNQNHNHRTGQQQQPIGLNFAQFHRSLHQLADHWTFTLEGSEYATFLRCLLNIITESEEDEYGILHRTWKSLPFNYDLSSLGYDRKYTSADDTHDHSWITELAEWPSDDDSELRTLLSKEIYTIEQAEKLEAISLPTLSSVTSALKKNHGIIIQTLDDLEKTDVITSEFATQNGIGSIGDNGLIYDVLGNVIGRQSTENDTDILDIETGAVIGRVARMKEEIEYELRKANGSAGGAGGGEAGSGVNADGTPTTATQNGGDESSNSTDPTNKRNSLTLSPYSNKRSSLSSLSRRNPSITTQLTIAERAEKILKDRLVSPTSYTRFITESDTGVPGERRRKRLNGKALIVSMKQAGLIRRGVMRKNSGNGLVRVDGSGAATNSQGGGSTPSDNADGTAAAASSPSSSHPGHRASESADLREQLARATEIVNGRMKMVRRANGAMMLIKMQTAINVTNSILNLQTKAKAAVKLRKKYQQRIQEANEEQAVELLNEDGNENGAAPLSPSSAARRSSTGLPQITNKRASIDNLIKSDRTFKKKMLGIIKDTMVLNEKNTQLPSSTLSAEEIAKRKQQQQQSVSDALAQIRLVTNSSKKDLEIQNQQMGQMVMRRDKDGKMVMMLQTTGDNNTLTNQPLDRELTVEEKDQLENARLDEIIRKLTQSVHNLDNVSSSDDLLTLQQQREKEEKEEEGMTEEEKAERRKNRELLAQLMKISDRRKRSSMTGLDMNGLNRRSSVGGGDTTKMRTGRDNNGDGDGNESVYDPATGRTLRRRRRIKRPVKEKKPKRENLLDEHGNLIDTSSEDEDEEENSDSDTSEYEYEDADGNWSSHRGDNTLGGAFRRLQRGSKRLSDGGTTWIDSHFGLDRDNPNGRWRQNGDRFKDMYKKSDYPDRASGTTSPGGSKISGTGGGLSQSTSTTDMLGDLGDILGGSGEEYETEVQKLTRLRHERAAQALIREEREIAWARKLDLIRKRKEALARGETFIPPKEDDDEFLKQLQEINQRRKKRAEKMKRKQLEQMKKREKRAMLSRLLQVRQRDARRGGAAQQQQQQQIQMNADGTSTIIDANTGLPIQNTTGKYLRTVTIGSDESLSLVPGRIELPVNDQDYTIVSSSSPSTRVAHSTSLTLGGGDTSSLSQAGHFRPSRVKTSALFDPSRTMDEEAHLYQQHQQRAAVANAGNVRSRSNSPVRLVPSLFPRMLNPWKSPMLMGKLQHDENEEEEQSMLKIATIDVKHSRGQSLDTSSQQQQNARGTGGGAASGEPLYDDDSTDGQHKLTHVNSASLLNVPGQSIPPGQQPFSPQQYVDQLSARQHELKRRSQAVFRAHLVAAGVVAGDDEKDAKSRTADDENIPNFFDMPSPWQETDLPLPVVSPSKTKVDNTVTPTDGDDTLTLSHARSELLKDMQQLKIDATTSAIVVRKPLPHPPAARPESRAYVAMTGQSLDVRGAAVEKEKERERERERKDDSNINQHDSPASSHTHKSPRISPAVAAANMSGMLNISSSKQQGNHPHRPISPNSKSEFVLTEDEGRWPAASTSKGGVLSISSLARNQSEEKSVDSSPTQMMKFPPVSSVPIDTSAGGLFPYNQHRGGPASVTPLAQILTLGQVATINGLASSSGSYTDRQPQQDKGGRLRAASMQPMSARGYADAMFTSNNPPIRPSLAFGSNQPQAGALFGPSFPAATSTRDRDRVPPSQSLLSSNPSQSTSRAFPTTTTKQRPQSPQEQHQAPRYTFALPKKATQI